MGECESGKGVDANMALLFAWSRPTAEAKGRGLCGREVGDEKGRKEGRKKERKRR